MKPVKCSARHKGQAILELLATYSAVQHPLSLYLTDGLVYHRLTLLGKKLACWKDIEPQQALHCMVRELKKASCSTSGSLAPPVKMQMQLRQ